MRVEETRGETGKAKESQGEPGGSSNPKWPTHHTKKHTTFYLAKLTSKN